VVADRRGNAVIVQAPPAEIEGVGRMIAELDEAIPDDSLSPKIFHLKYVSAVDMEDVLNELFLKKQQSRSNWDYVLDNPSDNSSGGQDAGLLRRQHRRHECRTRGQHRERQALQDGDGAQGQCHRHGTGPT
jgi:hypothetical protein